MSSSVARTPISARFTCDGADLSPPLRWGSVPASTVEIDLFVFNAKLRHARLFSDWGVAGLSPRTRALTAGGLPRSAIVGRNGFGLMRYSVCPPKGSGETYIVQVDPVPQRLPVKPGFDPEGLANRAVQIAEHEGQLIMTYARP